MCKPATWSACLSAFLFLASLSHAQSANTAQAGAAAVTQGPTDSKAKKTYDDALQLMKRHAYVFALDGFRKADKQDGGHCVQCELKAWRAANEIENWKAAREQAEMLFDHVISPMDKAQAQFMLGRAWLAEGIGNKHDQPLEAAHAAFQAALQLRPNWADCLYADGNALAHLRRDEAAKERFETFLKVAGKDDLDYARAQRFVEHPELARARVAPNFRLTTLDGSTLTLESLAGKVVLIDFWATWCGPCRQALPHIKNIAARFAGQPFVVLSVSMDKDESRWMEFVAKNQMTWLQYCDGAFPGRVGTLFGVSEIPATFTIDADGVLEDQHAGDADIEGKLKKLIARAAEVANRRPLPPVPEIRGNGTN